MRCQIFLHVYRTGRGFASCYKSVVLVNNPPPLQISWASGRKITTIKTVTKGKKSFKHHADRADFHDTTQHMAAIGQNPHLHRPLFSPPAALFDLKTRFSKTSSVAVASLLYEMLSRLPNCPPTEKAPFRVIVIFSKAGPNHTSVLIVLTCGTDRKINSLSSIQGNLLLCWSDSSYWALTETLT